MRLQEVRSSVAESRSQGSSAETLRELQEPVLANGGRADNPLEENLSSAGLGYVYVIGTSANGEPMDLAKIGKALDPSARIAKIEAEYSREPKIPFQVATRVLVLECQLADMGNVEIFLHQHFAKQRLEGEWFKLSEQDWEWISELSLIPYSVKVSNSYYRRTKKLNYRGPELPRKDGQKRLRVNREPIRPTLEEMINSGIPRECWNEYYDNLIV